MKMILTFDDGPSENFPNLLDYLIKKNQKAIFFCCGKSLENKFYEKYLIKAIQKDFIIGNHSYSHPNFSLISYRRGKEEIFKTDKRIDELYRKANKKRKIKLFRFPYFCKGGFNFFKYQKLLKNLGYSNPYFKKTFFDMPLSTEGTYHFLHSIISGKYDFYCDVDTKDWDIKNNFEKIKHVLEKAENGDVIVLHDHNNNFELDKSIINYLSKK